MTQTWETFHAVPSGAKHTLFDIWGVRGSPIFVVGEAGTLLRSDDVGVTWTALDSGFQGTLWQLAGSGGDDVFAVGYTKHGSVILHSHDGTKFRKLSIGRRQMLRSVAVWGDEVYAAGSREIVRSVDHGKTFEVVYREYNSLSKLLCLGPGHVIGVGYDTILVTTDGGKKWNKKSHPVPAHLNGVDGSPAYGLYAVGAWDVVVSTDRGEDWTSVLRNAALNLQDIAVWGPDDVYVAGWNGDILHAQAKQTFATVHSGGGIRRLRAIGEHVFAVGSAVHRAHRGERPEGAVFPPGRARLAASANKSTKKNGAKSTTPTTSTRAADPASVAKLREVIDRSEGRTWISIESEGLTSLDALEGLPDIEHISFMGSTPDLSTLPPLRKLRGISFYGKVTDLAPLASQPALIELSFWRLVASLQGVQAISTLEKIDVGQSSKVDAKNLAGCPSLVELILPKNVENFTALNGSHSLRRLSLATAHRDLATLVTPLTSLSIGATDDLAAVAHLKTLTTLSVHGTFSDLRPLSALENLESLDLSSPLLSSLAPLGQLHSLRSLSAGDAVEDLSPLRTLVGSASLAVGRRVKDLSPLNSLVSLVRLNLNGNESLRDLKGIFEPSGTLPGTNRPALAQLDLDGTAVQDLAPLAGLTTLESLDLSNTKIESIEPLRGLTKLSSLRLGRSRLRSLAGIEGLTSLTSLAIERTKVSDLSPLRGLTALESLSASHLGPVSNDDALATLSSLQGLFVEKTKIDPAHLASLRALVSVHGVSLPPPTAIEGHAPERTGDTLGPGSVIDGRIGLVKLVSGTGVDVALSPDGSHVAIAVHRGNEAIEVYDTKTANKVASFGGGARAATGVVFSGDGRELFFALRQGEYDNDLELWRAALHPGPAGVVHGRGGRANSSGPSGRPTKLATLPRRYGGRLCLASDGRTLAVVGDRVDLWDLERGEIVRTLMGNLAHGQLCAVAAVDTPSLYIWGLEPSEIARYDLEKASVTKTWSAPYQAGAFLSIDRREQVITASGESNFGAFVIDTESGERRLTSTFFAEQHLAPPVVSPDGTLIVSIGTQLRAHRLPNGPSLNGPRSGIGGYSTTITAVDVARALVVRDDSSPNGLIAASVVNYRGEGNHLLWFPLVAG